MASASVTVRVPAKVNLQLSVGPARPDGYHELATVFHAVGLFDDVIAREASDGAGTSLTISGEGAGSLPLDGTNL
ncbi:MAG: 4-(cytidine 5'-diphospho)-2-C-methyl-D-erythritol kinase, partial [Actinobacteria bacterium]|nr:4-(cytidine 5'-diphospho)-2-C-methyl-D-erythritol kinase [Actinomycetota bacterium]